MAKFRGNELYLADGQRVRFGDSQDSNMWWDPNAPHTITSGDLRIDTTVSGVDPIYDYHLTTKHYVDDEISTLSGTIPYDHGALTGLLDDDHPQYVPTDGSRGFTSTVSGVDPTQDYHLTTKSYVDNEINTLSGTIPYDHGDLTGLSDDDHQQYILVNGSRGFTGTVSGINPTQPYHLTTKYYVDNVANNIDWQDSVINFQNTPPGSPSTGDRYVVTATATGAWVGHEDDIAEWNGSSWDFTTPNEGFAVWDETGDRLMIYNGTSWVRFGSTITHNNLAGLQGGVFSNEYYHLTAIMYNTLTSVSGIVNASSQHIHDDRYYTESEIDTTLSGYALLNHTHTASDITDFTEAAQDAVGNIIVGSGSVTVTYDDAANTITVSGSDVGVTDHGALTGLLDDDHPQYVLVDGTRGFTATVSGVDPTQSYHLATRNYVDTHVPSPIYEHGRQSISNGVSQVSVTFTTALSSTNYTVNATLENTTDSPPSIYAFIVSAKTTTGFTITLMGDTDSANYVLDWSVISD